MSGVRGSSLSYCGVGEGKLYVMEKYSIREGFALPLISPGLLDRDRSARYRIAGRTPCLPVGECALLTRAGSSAPDMAAGSAASGRTDPGPTTMA